MWVHSLPVGDKSPRPKADIFFDQQQQSQERIKGYEAHEATANIFTPAKYTLLRLEVEEYCKFLATLPLEIDDQMI